MVIVDPKGGRPKAREYVLVQSEFYGSGGEYAKMLNDSPGFVVFNGQTNRYKTTPLMATAGELVRLFIVNARPNSSSAFQSLRAMMDGRHVARADAQRNSVLPRSIPFAH